MLTWEDDNRMACSSISGLLGEFQSRLERSTTSADEEGSVLESSIVERPSGSHDGSFTLCVGQVRGCCQTPRRGYRQRQRGSPSPVVPRRTMLIPALAHRTTCLAKA
jgi:hypothetical protein